MDWHTTVCCWYVQGQHILGAKGLLPPFENWNISLEYRVPNGIFPSNQYACKDIVEKQRDTFVTQTRWTIWAFVAIRIISQVIRNAYKNSDTNQSVMLHAWKVGGGGGGIRHWLPTTHGHITDCKLDSVVHAGVCGCMCGGLIWTCLVWVDRSTPNSFGCQTTDSISPQASRIESLRPLCWLQAGQSVA